MTRVIERQRPLLSIIVTGHGNDVLTHTFLDSLKGQRRYSEAPHSRNPKIMCPFAKAEDWKNHELPPMEIILAWDGRCELEVVNTMSTDIVKIMVEEEKSLAGHHTRAAGIAAAKGSWIYLTNCDNMVFHGWLDYVLPFMHREDAGGIAWNIVNNLWGWSILDGVKMQRGHIDLSSAMVRAKHAKKVGFPFREYDGDFDYLNACHKEVLAAGQTFIYLPATLGVHN